MPDIDLATPVAAQVFGAPPSAVKIYNQVDVPGWQTTAPDGRIELWQSGFGGVNSFAGAQHAEVNANSFGALFQDLSTTPDTNVLWSFAHRGRNGVDSVEVLIGPPGGPLQSQGVFSTGTGAWDVKRGSYPVPAGQLVTRFQFLAVVTANSSPTVGNFVDDVRVTPDCDYGDAPASFPVTSNNGGAAHRVKIGAFLGVSVDSETDGSPGNSALGDDSLQADDEDGVSYGVDSTLIRGRENLVGVVASQAGYVNLWVDLDGDGVWQEDERLLADSSVVAGDQTFTLSLPPGTANGTSFARMRYTTDDPAGSLSVGGAWPNGEVEDSRVTLSDPLPPELTLVKQVAMESDPVSGVKNPKALPGGFAIYSIVVTNSGAGTNDAGTIVLTDVLPAEVTFFSGDFNGQGSPFQFLEGTPASGAVVNFAGLADENDDVLFLDAAQNAVTPNGDFDPNVREIRIELDESIAPAGGSFELQFRVRIN